jgi:hypothetical protein
MNGFGNNEILLTEKGKTVGVYHNDLVKNTERLQAFPPVDTTPQEDVFFASLMDHLPPTPAYQGPTAETLKLFDPREFDSGEDGVIVQAFVNTVDLEDMSHNIANQIFKCENAEEIVFSEKTERYFKVKIVAFKARLNQISGPFVGVWVLTFRVKVKLNDAKR